MSEHNQPGSALVVPDMMLRVAENLRDNNPVLLSRLSWHDLRTITAPLSDHIAALEREIAELRQRVES